MIELLIEADKLSSSELKEALEPVLSDIELHLIANTTTFRGSMLHDPTMLAAITQASATAISALIAAFSVIYVARMESGKSNSTTVIHIHNKISPVEPSLRIPLEKTVDQSAQQILDTFPELLELAEEVSVIRYLDDE